MFGRKAIHANQVADLKATIEMLEHNLAKSRRERTTSYRNGYEKGRAVFSTAVAEAYAQGARAERVKISKECAAPHEHNLSEFEARIHADMLARPEQYSEHFGISRGRWSGRGPSLQNLPRHPSKKMVNVSFEYKGTRTTFGVNDIVRTLHTLDLQDGKKLRVICIKYDGSQTQYDYEVSRITSEIRKEFK